jgi:hypothetical protein
MCNVRVDRMSECAWYVSDTYSLYLACTYASFHVAVRKYISTYSLSPYVISCNFMYLCKHVRMYIYTVCPYVRMYVCTYVRMYKRMHVCPYVILYDQAVFTYASHVPVYACIERMYVMKVRVYVLHRI